MATTWRLLFKTTVPGLASVGEFILAAVPGGPSLLTGGVAAASSVYLSDYRADLAFDNNPGTLWSAAGPAPAWVQYSPTTEISPVELRLTARGDGRLEGSPITVDLQNDKAAPGTFVTVQSYTAAAWSSGQTQTFAVAAPAAAPAPGAYSTWRVVVHSNASDVVSIAEIVMASVAGGATLCSGGTASASTTNSSGLEPSKAFDGNPGTFWASSVGTPPDQWIQYAFSAPVTVAELRVFIRNDGYLYQAPGTFELQGSNDGSTFVKVGSTYTSAAWTAPGQTQAFAVPAAGGAVIIVSRNFAMLMT